MKPEDWILYVNEMETRYQDLAQRFDAALFLIDCLANDQGDVEQFKSEIIEALSRYEYQQPTHAGFSTSMLNQSPPKMLSGINMDLNRVAKEFYQKLANGEDPGLAKDYLDAYSDLMSDTPGWVVLPEFERRIKEMSPMMELHRISILHDKSIEKKIDEEDDIELKYPPE